MLVHHGTLKLEVTRSISTPLGGDAGPLQDTQTWSNWEYCSSPLDGMLVHHRNPKHEVTGSIITPAGWDASSSQGNQTRRN